MPKYSLDQPKRRSWKRLIIAVTAVVVVALVGGVIAIRTVYNNNLRPAGASQRYQTVTIPLGSSVGEIATILKDAGIIRTPWAFEWYIRNNRLRDSLQAGTYSLRESMSIPEIAGILTQGRIATDLITILPAQRLDQIRAGLINSGYSESDVDKALDPSLYADHPALVDKPKGASLEGYLYPESFQKTADTKLETIVRASLDELQKYLTPDVRAGIVAQGLTIHQGIILASVIEQEVGNASERPVVAQVFLKRLKDGMKLESDPTAKYGAINDGVTLPNDPARAAGTAINHDSLYNTYKYAGLMPGPISNVSRTSIEAVARPANTDYLFFVAGDDGKTYFSRSLEEHQALTREHCRRLCGLE